MFAVINCPVISAINMVAKLYDKTYYHEPRSSVQFNFDMNFLANGGLKVWNKQQPQF